MDSKGAGAEIGSNLILVLELEPILALPPPRHQQVTPLLQSQAMRLVLGKVARRALEGIPVTARALVLGLEAILETGPMAALTAEWMVAMVKVEAMPPMATTVKVERTRRMAVTMVVTGTIMAGMAATTVGTEATVAVTEAVTLATPTTRVMMRMS